MIDQRLVEGSTDGWHYADMPTDGEAWRLTLSFLDADAAATHGRGFAELTRDDQALAIQGVQDRVGDDWHGLPAGHMWSLWTRYACTAFYAHPWSWNEIGFGGSAYPRGYKNCAEVRADSMVSAVVVDERSGLATGVRYFRGGVERFQRARMVAVAGYSI